MQSYMARSVWIVCLLATAAWPRHATARSVEVVVAGSGIRGTAGERQWLAFQKHVEEAAAGELELKMLIYGELGSEEQIISGLRRGRVHFANVSALVASTVVPELSLLYAPYLFDELPEADFVLDKYLTAEYARMLAARGLHFVTWFDLGQSHIYAREPILRPADMRGRRFRVSASKSAELFARALGADVIPLGFADIVPGLETGLIEAGENALQLYARAGTPTAAPHLTLTGHSLGMSVIVAGKRWWEGLSVRQRDVLTRSFPSLEVTRAAIRAEDARDVDNATELGFTVHSLGSAGRAEWAAATRVTHEQLIEEIGGESRKLYELIQTGRAAYAKR